MVYKDKICYCGNIFTPMSSTSKYCSPECYKKKRKEWLKNDKKNNPQKYIERKKIYHQNRINSNREKGLIRLSERLYKCAICGDIFIPKGTGSNRYCKDDCKKIAADKNTKRLRKLNPERAKISNNNFYYRHKKEILENRKNDINYVIMNKQRGRVAHAVKHQGTIKVDKTIKLIGCSIDELKKYLEKQFKPGMTWKNYGIYGWHIDHIIPCCIFNLVEEEQQRICFHYTNLQPLWAKDNLTKGAKVFYNEVT